MDTDSVRAMSARFRRTASTMETSLASIRESVRSAPWQSQAREEFVQQLEMLHNSTLRSAEVLRLMALAAEQKANQWEAIGDRFNGPWQAMGNAWGQLKNMMGWLWSRIKNAVRGIKWPSVPKFIGGVAVGIGVVTFSPVLVVGGLHVINPDWFQKMPNWWPFKNSESSQESKTKLEDSSRGKKDEERADTSSKEDKDQATGIDQKQPYIKQYDGSKPAIGTTKPPGVDIDPPLKNSTDNREPDIYGDVLDQFAVETNPRYQMRANGDTFCNIYVSDATKAMGAEIPHWVDKNGNPVPQNQGSELSANRTIGWLETYGIQRGWKVITEEEAQAMANLGKPVVASWKNPTGRGHVAMVRPGEYTSGSGPHLAQAGSTNSNNTTANEIFGSREVVYYYHE